MNIFEALNAGNGKATRVGNEAWYVIREEGQFHWHRKDCKTNIEDPHRPRLILPELIRNDWIPYIPPVEVKKDCVKSSDTNLFSAWKAYFREYFKLEWQGFEENSIKLFIPPPVNVPRETIKHKKVYENIKWYTTSTLSLDREILYTDFGFDKFAALKDGKKILLNKPPMKMTLEWEE